MGSSRTSPVACPKGVWCPAMSQDWW